MLSRFVLRFIALTGLMLLTACTAQPFKVNQDPEARQIALEQLNAFRVKGGLGVWTDTESISTRIDWQQSGLDFDIDVSLPAGLTSVRVSQKDQQASVQKGSAAPITGRSASVLLQQALALSVAIPIDQMSLWMRGLPGESAESVVYDDQNRLIAMNYRDAQATLWRAKVLKYTTFDNIFVPATIIASGGPYNVRLVLRQWSKLPSGEIDTPETTSQPQTNGSRLKVPGR